MSSLPSLTVNMDTNPNPSPSPSRWFRSLRRTKPGDPCVKSCLTVCEKLLQRARGAFRMGRTLTESFRRTQLDALVRMLVDHECDFVDALSRDLRKPRFETVMSELVVVKNEALYATSNLKRWMEPQCIDRTLVTSLDECMVVSEPLGVVLVVGAWCSPVQHCLVPLVGAIAAGNCVIINPSETSPHTAELLDRIIPSYLDNECYHVILTGSSDLPEMVDLKFDHIFLTGNSALGSKVALSAARTLTPVSLVLGGKNPCYVDQHCDVATAARRIAWARFHNAGQSAVAPDYVLCHADTQMQLLQALRNCLHQFYGPDPRESRCFGRLVSTENFICVRDLIWKSGKVEIGGQVNEAERYIAPTVLTEVVESDPIMQQEVFGPVLPILTVQNLDEAVSIICRQEKPLCVYVYSSNSKVVSRLMRDTSSGSFCANDCILQSLLVMLPFGGVGASGMGSFHGRHSFDTFSHRKSCLLRSTRIECITYLRYPPYEDHNLSLMTWASTLSSRSQGWCQIL
ncbi:aldehyde dehydrogenase family 3 member B1 isoform X1 [Scleropages formosus]|uniref:aldehyde dehydrogenase family 3 member B1 isoform X1 n=1 Tax=Scleropages formosus TaxID=113540 RepID=UPI0008781700|nr:aldehyde dehydrogenase family 3 member B1-like isoform X1 [Scleropages formosus]